MKKVLIVDDQETIRKMLRLTLSGRYELFEASEASEAWETLRRLRPQAIILDIMMPGEMDGYQLCEKLKADRDLRTTHVVMVTARGQEADRQKGMAMGADAYFIKPFSPLALARHLEQALQAEGAAQ
jgi:two-component system phosphate regulon response regulator PhoB